MIIVRTLFREIRFHCPDRAIADALSYLSANPKVRDPTADPLEISVVPLGAGFYDLAAPYDGAPGTPIHIVDRVSRVLQETFLQEVGGDPVIKAGSLVMNGRRIILVTPDSFERHAVLLRCLSSDVSVEAGDHVVVRADHIDVLPQRIRLQARSADLIPSLRDRVLASPSYCDWDGNVIHALAPELEESGWTISPGVADVLVFLESNVGGLASAGRISKEAGFERLLQSAIPTATGRRKPLIALHVLSRSAQCWKLRTARSERDIWHLRRIAGMAANP